MVRSFIAVDIDEEDILRKIDIIQRVLDESGGDFKIVKKENIHLTLRFIGEADENRVLDIIEVLKNIKFNEFQLSLKGIGVFPNTRFIRVVWIGIENGVNQLSQIASALETGLRQFRFPPDNKPFSPHLTIARVRSKRNHERILETIPRWDNEDFGEMTIKAIRFKKSTLTPNGPIYSNLFEQRAAV